MGDVAQINEDIGYRTSDFEPLGTLEELTDGYTSAKIVAIEASANAIVLLDSDGVVWGMGKRLSDSGIFRLDTMRGVLRLSPDYTDYLSADDIDYVPKFKQIRAFDEMIAMIGENGELFLCPMDGGAILSYKYEEFTFERTGWGNVVKVLVNDENMQGVKDVVVFACYDLMHVANGTGEQDKFLEEDFRLAFLMEDGTLHTERSYSDFLHDPDAGGAAFLFEGDYNSLGEPAPIAAISSSSNGAFAVIMQDIDMQIGVAMDTDLVSSDPQGTSAMIQINVADYNEEVYKRDGYGGVTAVALGSHSGEGFLYAVRQGEEDGSDYGIVVVEEGDNTHTYELGRGSSEEPEIFNFRSEPQRFDSLAAIDLNNYAAGSTLFIDRKGTDHQMTHHDAVAPSGCTTDGNVEYWSCSGCGQNFADAQGNQRLDSIVDPAKHDLEHHEATEESAEYWECTVCGKCFSDADGINEITGENPSGFPGENAGIEEPAEGHAGEIAGVTVGGVAVAGLGVGVVLMGKKRRLK